MVYPTKNGDILSRCKRKISGRMHLQTDQEFQENIIKRLNKEYSVEMYSTKLRNGKTFAAEKNPQT